MTLDELVIIEQDQQGKTHYEPVDLTAKRQSQFHTEHWEFVEMPGLYWDAGPKALTIGATYTVKLTTKLKGGNSKPGSLYMDIREALPIGRAVPATGSQQAPVAPQAPARAPQAPQGIPEPPGEENRTPPPAKDAIQERIEKGMAFNGAYTLAAGSASENWVAGDDGMIKWIRAIRDQLYHEVIQVPVAPPRYCYEHDQERKANATNPGVWFHEHEGNYCTGAGMVDQQGQQVDSITI